MKSLRYLPYVSRFFFKNHPVEITFFVTSACNFRCNFCFNWRNIESPRIKSELTITEIAAISEKMAPFIRLLITGGEPFLRPDLDIICKLFAKNNNVLHITIPTNGYLTDRIVSISRKIAEQCRNTYVNISLSLDELGERRDRIVGIENTFGKLEDSFRGLCNLKKHYDNLGVGVITTFASYNQDRLEEIYNFATKTWGVDNFGLCMVRGDIKNPDKKDVDISKYEMITRLILSDAKNTKKMNFPFSGVFLAKRAIVYRSIVKIIRDNDWQMPCYAGGLRVVITPHGQVYPCEPFMLEEKYLIGDLREVNYDFNRIYNSPQNVKARKFIRGEKCFCTHECDLTINSLFNLKFLPRVLVGSLKY